MIHCVTTMNKEYYDGIGKVMIATWLELPVTRGRSFAIRAGSVNVLGWEHINKVIWSMGAVPSGPGVGR